MYHDCLHYINLFATSNVIFNPLANFFGNKTFTLDWRWFAVGMLYNTFCVDHDHAPLNLSDLNLPGDRLNFWHLNGQLTERPVSDSERCEHKKFLLRLELILFVGPLSHLRVLVSEELERNHHVELLVRHLSHFSQHYWCNCDLRTFWNTLRSLIRSLTHAKLKTYNWVMLQVVNCHSIKILCFKLRDLSKCIDLILSRITINQRAFIFNTVLEFHSHY